MSELSICIPRIDNRINRNFIAFCFKNVGMINRIDIVKSNSGFCKAFIHFRKCYDNNIGNDFKSLIEQGKTVKFVYSDDGWFWKCSKSRSKKGENRN
jgi:hypothetical protein